MSPPCLSVLSFFLFFFLNYLAVPHPSACSPCPQKKQEKRIQNPAHGAGFCGGGGAGDDMAGGGTDKHDSEQEGERIHMPEHSSPFTFVDSSIEKGFSLQRSKRAGRGTGADPCPPPSSSVTFRAHGQEKKTTQLRHTCKRLNNG